MHKYTFFLLLLLTTITAKSQFDITTKKDPASTVAKSDAGSLIAEIANALKTEALNKSFVKQKKSFVESANKTSKTEELVKSAIALFSNVKPGYFKDAVFAQSVISGAEKIQTRAALSELLKKFESNLKPQALNNFWKLQRASWLQSLGKLK